MTAAPLYREELLDHFIHPRNVGVIESADGVGKVDNPVCGDVLKIYLKIKGDRIIDAKFQSFGCGAAVATSSLVTEMVKGKTLKEALALSRKEVEAALNGLPPAKKHCSTLAAEALQAAIEDYRKKKGK